MPRNKLNLIQATIFIGDVWLVVVVMDSVVSANAALPGNAASAQVNTNNKRSTPALFVIQSMLPAPKAALPLLLIFKSAKLPHKPLTICPLKATTRGVFNNIPLLSKPA